MKHHLASLCHASLTALSGIGQVLRRPRYAASALVGALGFAWLIFLLTNGGFYGALLVSRLPLIDKLSVIGTMFVEIARQAATSLTGALLVLIIALGLSLFSLYRSGQIAAIYITLAQQEEHHAVTTNRG